MAKQFIKAMPIQNQETNMKAIFQLNKSVEVKKLVSKAPPIFPALPLEHHKPTMAPLPLFPNQLEKIVVQAGHPKDCIKPLMEKSKQNKYRLI